MIRYAKYLFLAVIALCLVVVALANRGPVTLRALPDDLAVWLGGTYAIELPLFLVIFAGIVAGLLIGFVWEWLREHRLRVEGRNHLREKKQLEREVKALKGRQTEGQDEVLALLEDTGPAR